MSAYRIRFVILAACAAMPGWSTGALAQDDGGGRAVVQPLPSPAAAELNQALKRLARNSSNLEALIAAGTASLELNDVDAAVGFFGRADELSPNNPQVKAGKAAAYARTRRPVEALRLFREAEQGGVEIVRLAADHGLAYDLVGNNREAQIAYRRALARSPSDEVSRRLALSQAIEGNAEGFEQTLRPLLARRDFAAYRARAFGLAILGKAEDAVAITEAVMPADMAGRIAPYLRFMPRLTKAQQAAAANLGLYPRAAQIGRDDPRIAALGTPKTTRQQGAADTGLAPAGQPLGRQDAVSPRQSESVAREVRAARRASASDPLTRASERVRVVRRETSRPESVAAPAAAPVPTPIPSTTLSESSSATSSSGAEAPRAALPAAAGELPALARNSAPATVQTVAAGAAVSDTRVPEADEPPLAPQSEPVVVATLAGESVVPGFDLARVGSPVDAPAQAAAATLASSAAGPDTPTPSVSDAFSDLLGAARTPATAASGAVDITAIEPPREVAPEPEARPAKPAHPSRFWVQVATGQDRAALRFDWRRLSRKAPDTLGDNGPFVTVWGQSNRLLAGPYPSRDAARKALNELKENGIDAFTFTSPEGQEIEDLG